MTHIDESRNFHNCEPQNVAWEEGRNEFQFKENCLFLFLRNFSGMCAKYDNNIKIPVIINFHYLFSSIFAAVTRRTPAGMTMDLFEQHQGTHILQVSQEITKSGTNVLRSSKTKLTENDYFFRQFQQSLDGFALALAADGRFLYISETVSIYLGLSQASI